MQSAFVDIGQERDAFLYVADVIEGLDENLLTPEETGQAPPAGNGGGSPRGSSIEEMLEPGQDVLVQVVKEPLGQKGARITSHVSLPGRYVVFMPTVEHVGVSRKIVDDDERRRLKTLLKELRQERGGGGLIARTVGEGHTRDDFERDLRFLSRTWDEVRALSSRQPAPALLHRELGLVQRLLRDILSDDIANIRLDAEKEFQKTLDMVNVLQPELAPRVRLYNGPQAILEEYGVAGELERALRSKVWLESGGYIVINQTEALVAIDVNTGRFTGKKNLEETILKTNLEAMKEIVRQIRLRDLGGIIVVDFIDMEERKSRQKVMAALEQELRKDRSPSKLLSVNEFGLVILTRKRVRQSLERTLCEPCPYCSGSGMVKNVATVCSEIYDEVRKLAPHFSGQAVSLRVNPEVARALRAEEAPVLKELRGLLGHEVLVHADPLLHQEQFDVVPK
jgi:ribonuclease G